MTRTLLKALASLLFFTLMLVSPWTLAAGDSSALSHGKAEKVRCDDKNPNCRPSATAGEVAQSFIRNARLDACPEDAPDCAWRAKVKRAHVDDEVRDRHACRD